MKLSWGRIVLTLFVCMAATAQCIAYGSFTIKSLSIDSTQKNLLLQGVNPDLSSIKISKQLLANPSRVIYDISNAKLVSPKNSAVLNNPNISEVRVAQFSNDPALVRVVFYCRNAQCANSIKPVIKSSSISFGLDNVKDSYDNSFFIFKEDMSSADIKSNVDYSAFYTKLNVVIAGEKTKTTSTQTPTPIKKPDNTPDPGWTQIPISEDFPARYTILDVESAADKVIIKGKGIIAVESPFSLVGPNRFVIDLPQSKMQRKDLYKDVMLTNGDKVRFGAFDEQTARVVVESPNSASYNAIISPNAEELIIQKSNTINAPVANLLDVKSYTVNNYSSKMILRFDKPIYHSISKTKDQIKLNFYNINKPSEQVISSFSQTKQFRKISACDMSGNRTGQTLVIPVNPSSKATIELKPDGKELTIALKENVRTQATVVLKKGTTVVLDAGHGGSDYGAIREGVNEKDLTLEMTKKLKSYLQNYGVKVVMTRDKDETVSLQRRSEISNEINPDAFVSIHINSFTKPEAVGLETYWYQPQSKALGQIVQNYLALSIDSPDRGLQSARFYVINHTKAPSILAEVGYISNPKERAEMCTSQRQQKTVKAIGDAVLLYLGMMYEQSNK